LWLGGTNTFAIGWHNSVKTKRLEISVFEDGLKWAVALRKGQFRCGGALDRDFGDGPCLPRERRGAVKRMQIRFPHASFDFARREFVA
jgi:hypothetical protein